VELGLQFGVAGRARTQRGDGGRVGRHLSHRVGGLAQAGVEAEVAQDLVGDVGALESLAALFQVDSGHPRVYGNAAALGLDRSLLPGQHQYQQRQRSQTLETS